MEVEHGLIALDDLTKEETKALWAMLSYHVYRAQTIGAQLVWDSDRANFNYSAMKQREHQDDAAELRAELVRRGEI